MYKKNILVFIFVVILFLLSIGCRKAIQYDLASEIANEEYEKNDMLLKEVNNISEVNDIKTVSFDSNDIIVELFSDIEGVWLNAEYVNEIVKNKSPKEALSKDIIFYSIQFYKNKSKYYYNIADIETGIGGEISKITIVDNIYNIHTENNDEQENIIKYIRDNNGVGFVQYGNQRFTYVGEAEEDYYNRTLLKGKYISEEGCIYVFNEDNMAEWPDNTFKYIVERPVFASYDYFECYTDEGEPLDTYYAYEFKNNKLLIYQLNIDENYHLTNRTNEPLLVLNRLNE